MTLTKFQKEAQAIHRAMDYDRVVMGINDFLVQNEEDIKNDDGIKLSHKEYLKAVDQAIREYLFANTKPRI